MKATIVCYSALVALAALMVTTGCQEAAVTDPEVSGRTDPAQTSADSSADEGNDSAVAASAELQGTWVITRVEYKGEDVAGMAGTRAVVDGDQVAIESPGARAVSSMTLDLGKDPAWMDTTNSTGTTLAIYRLDGDQLWICAGPANAETDRPADFATSADSEAMLFEYKRADPQ